MYRQCWFIGVYNKTMKVIAVLIAISTTIATVCAFTQSRSSVQYNNVGRTQSSALNLFNFKAKEASSVATISGGDITAAKKKFDGILKKNSKLILMISGSAKDGIKGEFSIELQLIVHKICAFILQR